MKLWPWPREQKLEVFKLTFADMAELEDAPDLGSGTL